MVDPPVSILQRAIVALLIASVALSYEIHRFRNACRFASQARSITRNHRLELVPVHNPRPFRSRGAHGLGNFSNESEAIVYVSRVEGCARAVLLDSPV